MYKFPLGVIIDSFRLPTKEAICEAAKLGAEGIQMYSSTGENSPEMLSCDKRKELLSCVKGEGLCVSALCGDLGHGFGNKELNAELIEKSKRILDLAKDLETDIVTTHIGVVPEDSGYDRYKIMQEACFELGQYADSIDAHFAIETGPEKSIVLKDFLDSLDSKGIAVNLDPANLAMVTGENPVSAVYNLKEYIVHTHAKDGNMLISTNPEYIYGVLHPLPEELINKKLFEEVPIGTGSVNFTEYLMALEDVGYRGYLTIEREVGDNPAADIKTAMEYLTKIMED